MIGVSFAGFPAHIDDLVLALDEAEEAVGVAEHPPRMRRPPRRVSERAACPLRFEGLLRPSPSITMVDRPNSASVGPGQVTSADVIDDLYLSPTCDAEKGSLDQRAGSVSHPRSLKSPAHRLTQY